MWTPFIGSNNWLCFPTKLWPVLMDHLPCICHSSFSASLRFFDSCYLGITLPINKAFTHKLCLRLCLQRKLAEGSLKAPQSEILELILYLIV